MKDRDYLMWLHERLEHVHDESPLVDYMHKLRCIIAATPPDRETPNDGRGQNSLDKLRGVKWPNNAISKTHEI
jgi:hypothetical protein